MRPAPCSPVQARAALPPSQPQRELERPAVHIHHHWHGVVAEDAAAIIERHLPDG